MLNYERRSITSVLARGFRSLYDFFAFLSVKSRGAESDLMSNADTGKVCEGGEPPPTAHVGAVDDRFAPRAPAIVFVGANAKFVGGVGFQVVDDGFTGWAGLVDPFSVPLSVADGVEPEEEEDDKIKIKKRMERFHKGISQGYILEPQLIH